ncbi:MAG: hypothetical protein RJA22_1115 [Verrucomicrobiota bacterium]|jgi:hypothetical protein
MKNQLLLLPRVASLAGFLLGGVLTAAGQAAFPYGTWDCVISERQSGLAVLSFGTGTNAFSGLQVVRPGYGNGNLITSSTNPRYTGGDPTRDGTESSQGSSSTNGPFVGATAISGQWYYEDGSTNRIIGFLDQISARYELTEVITTNFNELQNVEAYVTNLAYVAVNTTNSVSFRASGTGGQRLLLTAYLPSGKKSIFRGTPSVALPSQAGEFYATGKRSGQPYVEFFQLTANPEPSLPNVYTIAEGNGAGYNFTGQAIVSRTGRIAIFQQTDRDPYRITTYLGPYNSTLRRGSINGYDDLGRKPTYRLVHY